MNDAVDIRKTGKNQIAFAVSLTIVAALATTLIAYFYNQYWFPVDEGYFAYMADQTNSGRVFGKDFFSNNTGYLILLDAFLFEHLGRDLIVFRYPLMIISVITPVILCLLFRQTRPFFVIVTGAWFAVFGFVQFLNPSANWYCLFFALLTAVLLSREKPQLYFLAGILVGLTLGFRHASGLFLGAGLLCCLVCGDYRDHKEPQKSYALAYVIGTLTVLAPVFYTIITRFDVSTFLYLNIWPIIFGCFVMARMPATNAVVIQRFWRAAAGGIIAIVPLILYQLAYGDISTWFATTIVEPLTLLGREHYADAHFWDKPVVSAQLLFEMPNIVTFGNFLYWIIIWSAIPIAMIAGLVQTYRRKLEPRLMPFVLIAAFYGYCALYYQHQIYLYYVLPLFVLALLLVLKGHTAKLSASVVMLFTIVLNLVLFAAVADEPTPTRDYVPAELDGVSLHISPYSKAMYGEVIETVEELSDTDDSIFAFPANPEFYFLTGRKNPTPYISTSVSIHNDAQYEELVRMLEAAAPQMLIVNFKDKYFQEYDKALEQHFVKSGDYRLHKTVERFRIYEKL